MNEQEFGFVDEVPVTRLAESRQRREQWVREFGDIPSSIWDVCSDPEEKNVPDKFGFQFSRFKASTDKLGQLKNNTGWGIGHGMGFSGFEYGLAVRLLKFYSAPGDHILDPFMGRLSRLHAAIKNGRHYTGYDVCEAFLRENEAHYADLREEAARDMFGVTIPSARFVLCDSRQMEEPENTYDALITCPPYYDMEGYGPNTGAIELLEKYDDFLEAMTQIFTNCFRALKPGKFAAVVIGDLVRQRQVIPLGADTGRCLVRAGFIWHDFIVKRTGHKATIFAEQIFARRRVGRCHEYIVVGRKPGDGEGGTWDGRGNGPERLRAHERFTRRTARGNGAGRLASEDGDGGLGARSPHEELRPDAGVGGLVEVLRDRVDADAGAVHGDSVGGQHREEEATDTGSGAVSPDGLGDSAAEKNQRGGVETGDGIPGHSDDTSDIDF